MIFFPGLYHYGNSMPFFFPLAELTKLRGVSILSQVGKSPRSLVVKKFILHQLPKYIQPSLLYLRINLIISPYLKKPALSPHHHHHQQNTFASICRGMCPYQQRRHT